MNNPKAYASYAEYRAAHALPADEFIARHPFIRAWEECLIATIPFLYCCLLAAGWPLTISALASVFVPMAFIAAIVAVPLAIALRAIERWID